MNIYDKIRRMTGSGSYEEKMYQILNTPHYQNGQYEQENLNEDMSLVNLLVWGYWKSRFILDHRAKCAYEFMSGNFELLTVTDDDIDWDTLEDLPEMAILRAKAHNGRFPVIIHQFHNGLAKVVWQLNPDGRYFMDDDGFGMTDDEEIALKGVIDRTGKVVEKFRYSQ